jgi:hypothetical protein
VICCVRLRCTVCPLFSPSRYSRALSLRARSGLFRVWRPTIRRSRPPRTQDVNITGDSVPPSMQATCTQALEVLRSALITQRIERSPNRRTSSRCSQRPRLTPVKPVPGVPRESPSLTAQQRSEGCKRSAVRRTMPFSKRQRSKKPTPETVVHKARMHPHRIAASSFRARRSVRRSAAQVEM